MMRQIIYLVMSMLCISFYSCEIDEIPTYSGKEGIYFDQDSLLEEDQSFTVEKTFTFLDVGLEETSYTISIPVKASGILSNAKRTFEMEVVDRISDDLVTDAVEGTHFNLKNNLNYIEKGRYFGHAFVELVKTNDMSDKSYTLILKLKANGNFETIEDKDTPYYVVVRFSNKYEKPLWWYDGGDYGFDPHIGWFTQMKLYYWYTFHLTSEGSTYKGGGTDPWLEDKFVYWYTDYWTGEPELGQDYYSLIANVRAFDKWLTEHEDAPLYDEDGMLIVETLDKLEKPN